MRKGFLLLLSAMLLVIGCTSNDDTNVADVGGTWRATVTVSDCNPAAVCASAGFSTGTSLSAVLTISQNKAELSGTYSYTGVPISAPVSGRVGESVLSLSGLATVPGTGSATVNITGNASGNSMPSTVTHQITLTVGTAANVTATGTFAR
jgi:hypothetical protein